MKTDFVTQNKLNFLKTLNERDSRRFVGLWASEYGWGGILHVHNITKISINTIRRGISEITKNISLEKNQRIRMKGGGRKKISDKNPTILKELENIMENNTSGDPMKHLKWTIKSTGNIANELNRFKYRISPDVVGNLLKKQKYSLKANSKSKEGKSDPKRNSQFIYINNKVEKFKFKEQPVISVDTKKKELVGEFKNQGRVWLKKGKLEKVNVYDFPSLSNGKAIPYGTYDVQKNKGFVNVGISFDTGEFAVESISKWWKYDGCKDYPNAKEILICADGGGSNGSRNRSWKYYLHKFAKKSGLKITVCHYPPGTSKWNKIEHRMFSFISINWKGKPLINYNVIINLINATKTKAGLKIKAKLDKKQYKKGKNFSNKDMDKLNLHYHKINPKWNYSIKPINY